MSFGRFGKGKSFITSVIESDSHPINKRLLEKVADKLEWALTAEQKIAICKEELAIRGIRSHSGLISLSYDQFFRMQFGKFGGGIKFFSFIMNKKFKGANSLNELSVELGWAPRQEELIEKYREALVSNNLKSYWDLLVIDVNCFRELNFGVFGKGIAFCGEVLREKNLKVVKSHIIKIADIVGWKPTDEEKTKIYKEELAKHNIFTRSDLNSFTVQHFRSLRFGMFGAGGTFVNYVLNRIFGSRGDLTRKKMNDFSDKIDLN